MRTGVLEKVTPDEAAVTEETALPTGLMGDGVGVERSKKPVLLGFVGCAGIRGRNLEVIGE